jgi:hypothetical protein
MWAASESGADEQVRAATATATAKTPAISASAVASLLCSASAETSW